MDPRSVLSNFEFRAECSATRRAFCRPGCAMLPFCDRVQSIARSRYLPSRNRGIPVPKEPSTIGGHLRKRRLQLHIRQSEAAARLMVSTVTLSRWECDKVYPTWDHHRAIMAYLGFDPFTSLGLRDRYGNETNGVASLPLSPLCETLKNRRLELKLTRAECAEKLHVDLKTLQSWERGTRQPCRKHRNAITGFLQS